jgi:integrase
MGMLKDGVVSFRHPLLPNRPTIRRSLIGKCRADDHSKVEVSLLYLLKARPTLRDDCKPPVGIELHPLALKFWFDPLGVVIENAKLAKAALATFLLNKEMAGLYHLHNQRAMEQGIIFDPFDWDEGTSQFVGYLINEIKNATANENKKSATILELEDQILALRKATGQKSALQASLTLGKCLEHFQEHSSFKSAETRECQMRRIKRLVDHLKPSTLHSSIRLSDITKAVDAVSAANEYAETEKWQHASAMKRFFRELSYPVHSNGLALENPAVAYKVKSTMTLARARRRNGGIKILDPKPLIESPLMPLYWRAMFGIMGYAGLRMTECAALDWNAIDFDQKLIHVRASALYPELKSVMSERDCKPFGNIWPVLEDYRKATEAHETKLLFPKDGNGSWIKKNKDKFRALHLTERCIRTLKEAGMPTPEPTRRLRRYWETTMRAQGLAHLIEPMGGHENAVGVAHYTRNEAIVMAATVPTL